jgi:short-chain fatty acids transporter
MIASFNDTVRAQTGGVLTASIPIQETILAPYNLVILVGLLLVIPFVNAKMHPKDEDVVLINPALLKEDEFVPEKSTTPATWMENSRLLSLFVVFLGGVVLHNHFSRAGFAALNLNTVNLLFLIVGVLLHGTPIRYVKAINKGISGAGGILLQFPFYGGIMGMMSGISAATGLSLAKVISDSFAAVSTPQTWPLLSFLSCTFINLFVPSGGGQWAIQGPIIMPAGETLGVAPAITAMSYVWGDSWTNMIQPFWALPALGIAGLGARDIMGYCVVVLLASGVVIWSVMLMVGFGILV